MTRSPIELSWTAKNNKKRHDNIDINVDIIITKVNIVIKYVGKILPSDYAYVQFFNILLRNAMEKLQLELIRRDYYDPKAAVDFKAYRLELWPGYMTR